MTLICASAMTPFIGISSMPKVESSVIESIDYDPNSQSMAVVIKQTGTYIYDGVSEQEYKNFLNAGSHGKYFNKFIRNKFSVVKVSK